MSVPCPWLVVSGFFPGCAQRPADPAPVPTASVAPQAARAAVPVLDSTVETLGDFPFDEDHPVIPDRIRALNGSQVRLRGFMVPLDQTESITRFALVGQKSIFHPDPWPGPPIQQVVLINAPPGEPVKYTPDPIVVEGKLNVGLIRDEQEVVGVFTVDSSSVSPAAK